MAHAAFDLSGKTALITGATRGIGRGIAEAMGAAGARLVVSSESAADCTATEADLREQGFPAQAIPCDVSDRKQLVALVSGALSLTGSIDVLVCNAGIAGPPGPLHSLSDEDYQRLLSVNLTSVVRLTGLILPHMAQTGGGSVILMSSIAGLRGNSSIGAYGLTKAAVAQLARNIAVEWGPRGVRANAISPGLIRTEFAKAILEDEQYLERRLSLTPSRRVGEVHEVAAAAVFLASPGGGFVNGHNLVVDGGTIISDGN